tara:strand:- start:5189 stop:5419 length:231 start_codon:yes stop_codon:yes gene_type:complete
MSLFDFLPEKQGKEKHLHVIKVFDCDKDAFLIEREMSAVTEFQNNQGYILDKVVATDNRIALFFTKLHFYIKLSNN